MHDKKQLYHLYQTGMAFANQLRLIGEHDAAHNIEVYVLEMKMEKENVSTKE